MKVNIIMTVDCGVANLCGVYKSTEKALECLSEIIGENFKTVKDYNEWAESYDDANTDYIWYCSEIE